MTQRMFAKLIIPFALLNGNDSLARKYETRYALSKIYFFSLSLLFSLLSS